MRPLKALAESASELRVPLSLVLKSDLGREVLRTTSSVAGLVLQGGGAVHHVFGSPRFSADLGFAQQPDLDEARLPRPYLERFDPLQAVRKVRALYEELSR